MDIAFEPALRLAGIGQACESRGLDSEHQQVYQLSLWQQHVQQGPPEVQRASWFVMGVVVGSVVDKVVCVFVGDIAWMIVELEVRCSSFVVGRKVDQRATEKKSLAVWVVSVNVDIGLMMHPLW